MNSKAFKYHVRRKQELVTNIGDPAEFTIKFLDELGAKGELVVSLTEMNPPSAIQDAQGRYIPYYEVVVLTATEYDPATEPAAPAAVEPVTLAEAA